MSRPVAGGRAGRTLGPTDIFEGRKCGNTVNSQLMEIKIILKIYYFCHKQTCMLPLNRNILTLKLRRVWVQK